MAAHGKKVKKLAILAIMVVFMALSLEAKGDQSILCKMNKEGLEACQPSVSGPTSAPPSDACCAALSNADLQCLCQFMKSNPKLLTFYKIDPAIAKQLPAKCTPPLPFHC